VEEPLLPDGVAPARMPVLRRGEVALQLYEWGAQDAPPLVLCHGMFDHGRGFDALAPHLAARFRVIAFDARGHGESSWADAYGWEEDIDDVVAVLEWVGAPAHLLGHSRGGGLASDAAVRAPGRVRRLVNIDGFGPPPEGFEAPWRPRDERPLPQQLAAYLDWRREAAQRGAWRPYARFDDLVERRRAQNPRLSDAWLRHLAWHGARRADGGWVWKADPHAGRGFGPFRPEWIGPAWRGLRAPMLALTGSEPDTWGPLPEPLIRERLAHVPRVERAIVEGAGHFVHMERPAETAARVLAFLEAG
jgi:pimeloyl-ACP methyl ester carboxylesterase